MHIPIWKRYLHRGKHFIHSPQSRAWLVVPTIALAGLFITPDAAHASSAPVVMVESHLSGRYDVLLRRSAKYIDRFTMSRMVFGKCVPNKRCITVRNDGSLRKGTGYTRCLACARSSIGIHPAWQRSDTYWKRLLEHELGHAFGLVHNGGNNIMYPPIIRHGHVVAERFTNGDRAKLRRK